MFGFFAMKSLVILANESFNAPEDIASMKLIVTGSVETAGTEAELGAAEPPPQAVASSAALSIVASTPAFAVARGVERNIFSP